jgi:hypothetical protein
MLAYNSTNIETAGVIHVPKQKTHAGTLPLLVLHLPQKCCCDSRRLDSLMCAAVGVTTAAVTDTDAQLPYS